MSESSPRPSNPSAVAAATGRPSVIQLVFREKGALYAAYIPLFTDGGLFVPTTREYRLGEDIYLLLSLPDDPQRYPVAGKVGWITPANASGGRTQGVGVRFPADEKTRLLKLKIEEMLGTSISVGQAHADDLTEAASAAAPPGSGCRTTARCTSIPTATSPSRSCTNASTTCARRWPRRRSTVRCASAPRSRSSRPCMRWRCAFDNFWASAGVHPDNEGVREPTVDDLLQRAPRCRAWWPSAKPGSTTTA